MGFSLKIDAQKLSQAFSKATLEVSKELRIGLSIALRTVATDAKLHHDYKSKRGQIERSVKYEVSPSGLEGRVYLDTAICPYSVYVHEGTGIYGHGKGQYTIKPKSQIALYWVSGGEKVFAKTVTSNGIRPDPFLTEAFDRQKPYIQSRMQGAVNRAFQIAGL
jgi:hypothetical protein